MVETITSLDDQRLDVYARLTEVQLRNKLEPEKGIFIAEFPPAPVTMQKPGWGALRPARFAQLSVVRKSISPIPPLLQVGPVC